MLEESNRESQIARKDGVLGKKVTGCFRETQQNKKEGKERESYRNVNGAGRQ